MLNELLAMIVFTAVLLPPVLSKAKDEAKPGCALMGILITTQLIGPHLKYYGWPSSLPEAGNNMNEQSNGNEPLLSDVPCSLIAKPIPDLYFC